MNTVKPTGWIARCRCGAVVGAMDGELTPPVDRAAMLGRWVLAGCAIEPRFTGTWSVTLEPCRCRAPQPEPPLRADDLKVPGFYWYRRSEMRQWAVVAFAGPGEPYPLSFTGNDAPRALSDVHGEFRGPIPAPDGAAYRSLT